jgi:hypothetical protein
MTRTQFRGAGAGWEDRPMAMLLEGVSQRLLPQAGTQPRIVPWSVILHSVVTIGQFAVDWVPTQ